MTRTQYTKVIERELQALNERIDHKILRGESYKEESRKHKALLLKMRMQHHKSVFGRLFSGINFGF